MPQVSEESYDREARKEKEAGAAAIDAMSDDSKYRGAISSRIELKQERYSTSSSNDTDDDDDDDNDDEDGSSISNGEIRKVSTCSNASSASTCPSLEKYNEMIDQMIGLKFLEKNVNDAKVEESAGTGEKENDKGDDDEDLVERGPVRPHSMTQSHHEKPYYTLNWLASSGQNIDNDQLYMADYDCLSEIVQNKQLYEKLDPYIDKLSKEAQLEQSNYFIDNGVEAAGTPNGNLSGGNDAGIGSMPITSDVGDSILEQLTRGAYQEAGSLYDAAAATAGSSPHHRRQQPSPGATSLEHWPDSPASGWPHNENVPSLSPGSYSRGSSRAQSPGSSVNGGFQQYGSMGAGVCPQFGGINNGTVAAATAATSFRVCQALSSSDSSNHSFGDTSSPLSYESAIDHRTEQQLGFEFDSFSTGYPNYMSSDTLVNTAEIIDAIVDNEIQRVVEEDGTRSHDDRCQRFNNELSENEEAAAYSPRSAGKDAVAEPNATESSRMTEAKLNLARLGDSLPASIATTNVYDDVGSLTYAECMQLNNFPSNDASSFNNAAENFIDFNNTIENLLASHYADASEAAVPAIADSRPPPPPTTIDGSRNLEKPQSNDHLENGRSRRDAAATTKISESPFNEFQIPETVSAFRQNHLRRYSERQQQQQVGTTAAGAPWPCLNLPETAATERLKAQLDPREVEKAMKDLLKRPTEELAAADQDGDTMLMCLVGNCRELEKKKAYLVPLVERLGNIEGSLTVTNNRDEDALYIAAVYCPEMAYVAGYLAAAMLQKNIDIGRRLYRGDNLIHVLAAKGDSHAAVLAELLALKTNAPEGTSVFDVCQRNYTGRTALEIAVESHDPSGPSRLGCLGVTQLLLQNGADQKMQEITPYGNTALHTAVSLCRDPLLVKTLLLDKDAHQVVNMPNAMNDTPVHLAFGLSEAVPITVQIEICMDLMEAGGRTDLPNGRGKSPFALVSPDRRETMRNVFFKKKQEDQLGFLRR